MPPFPVISGKQAIIVFAKLGYHVERSRGSHFRLLCDSKNPLTIPMHSTLGKGLLRKLIRDAEISVKQFIHLLNG